MNRDVILKNFFSKLKEAKAQNARDVRLSLKEMDDLGYVLFELTSEFYDKVMSNSNTINKPNEGGVFDITPILSKKWVSCNMESEILSINFLYFMTLKSIGSVLYFEWIFAFYDLEHHILAI